MDTEMLSLQRVEVSNTQSGLAKFLQFVRLGLSHGVAYGSAIYRMKSIEPLDPKSNWEFWTKPRNAITEYVLRSYPRRSQRVKILDSMMQQDHATGIEFHYDVGNEFYKCFLDEKYMFYTAAWFDDNHTSLDQAQGHKGYNLLDWLDPRPGQQIRELGCGWSAMLKLIIERIGGSDGVIGYTLSKEQYDFAKEVGVNVELQDFTKIEYAPESIDGFISMGSLEHVRPGKELEDFYQKSFLALKPGGRMVNQFFSLEHQPFPVSMVLAQLFFPGSLLSLHSIHVEAIKTAGFTIEKDLIGSYQETLRAWYDNLVRNREQAIGLVGVRVYNEYLTFFPAAWRFFEDGDAQLHRMLLVKPE